MQIDLVKLFMMPNRFKLEIYLSVGSRSRIFLEHYALITYIINHILKTLTSPLGVFLSQIGRQLISLLNLENIEKREKQASKRYKLRKEISKQTKQSKGKSYPTS
jgi:hypothetical protein